MELPPGCLLLLAALLPLAKRSSPAPHKTGQEELGMGECGWVMAGEWRCSGCCCCAVLPTAPNAARCLQVWDCGSLGSDPRCCRGPCSVPLTGGHCVLQQSLGTATTSQRWRTCWTRTVAPATRVPPVHTAPAMPTAMESPSAVPASVATRARSQCWVRTQCCGGGSGVAAWHS